MSGSVVSMPCPTCSGPSRETVGMVCQTCGADYGSDPIHLAHFHDGYPMCWPMDRDGPNSATTVESSVTCPDCRRIVAEWDAS